MHSILKGFNIKKSWTIFTGCVTTTMRSEDAFLFATERLERYKSDLNDDLSASASLGCGTSSVRSAKYSDTIAIQHQRCQKTKGSGTRIKGGKELTKE